MHTDKKCMRGKVLGSVFGKDVCETFAEWISDETVGVNWARHSLFHLAGHRGPPSLSPMDLLSRLDLWTLHGPAYQNVSAFAVRNRKKNRNMWNRHVSKCLLKNTLYFKWCGCYAFFCIWSSLDIHLCIDPNPNRGFLGLGETKRKDQYLIAVGDRSVEQKAAEMQSGINVLGGSSVEHGKGVG